MRQTRSRIKRQQSAQLSADVAKFLAAGGEIQPVTFEDTKTYRDQQKKRRKSTKLSIKADEARVPTAEHQWRSEAPVTGTTI